LRLDLGTSIGDDQVNFLLTDAPLDTPQSTNLLRKNLIRKMGNLNEKVNIATKFRIISTRTKKKSLRLGSKDIPNTLDDRIFLRRTKPHGLNVAWNQGTSKSYSIGPSQYENRSVSWGIPPAFASGKPLQFSIENCSIPYPR